MGLLSMFLTADSSLSSSFLADAFWEAIGETASMWPRTFQGATEMLRVEPWESEKVDLLSMSFPS